MAYRQRTSSITFYNFCNLLQTIECCRAICHCVIDEKHCITCATVDGCFCYYLFSFVSLSNLEESPRKCVFCPQPPQHFIDLKVCVPV